MNYEAEIAHRKELLSRVRNGEKITSEDRLWLVTHRVYNYTLGYPYLNTDIIQLQSNVDYRVCIKVEHVDHPYRIIPVITVPGGKGGIITRKPPVDINGNVTTKRTVKMLALLLSEDYNETEVIYQSNLGLLGVSFECDYYDDKLRLMIRQNSDTGATHTAMLCEEQAENVKRYRCKAPNSDRFDNLVFSVEWTPL